MAKMNRLEIEMTLRWRKCGKSQLVPVEAKHRSDPSRGTTDTAQELKEVDMNIYPPPSDVNAEGECQLLWHAPAGTL